MYLGDDQFVALNDQMEVGTDPQRLLMSLELMVLRVHTTT